MKITKLIIKYIFLIFCFLSIIIKFNTIKIYLKEEPSVHLLLSKNLYKNYEFHFFSGYVLIKTSNDDFEKLCNQSFYITGGEHDFLGEIFYDYLVSIGWFINIIILIFILYKRLIRKNI